MEAVEDVNSDPVERSALRLWVAWSFCGVMAIIDGIPIFWLLRRDVRAHFMP